MKKNVYWNREVVIGISFLFIVIAGYSQTEKDKRIIDDA
jgi:hypothetical protein